MLIQVKSPMRIGLPPVLISFIILVFKPIAPIAIVIKNLPNLVKGFVSVGFILNRVLIIAANKKNKMNHGNILLNLTVVVVFFLERYNASINVIGIMARVRVSLTIVA